MSLQFTRQQLIGGASYQPKTKVGNWNEDVELQEWSMNEYRHKRDKNTLVSHEIAATYKRSMRQVYSNLPNYQGPICYGDKVMLRNAHVDGAMSIDIDTKTQWRLSSVDDDVPRARNVFQLIHPTLSNKESFGIPIRFQDAFQLASDKAIRQTERGSRLDPYFLTCQAKSYEHLARLSSQSPVHMSCDKSNKTLWYMESCANGDQAWLETTGRGTVDFSSPIVFKHKMTNCVLTCSDKFKYSGKVSGLEEFEVYGTLPGHRFNPSHNWTMQLVFRQDHSVQLDDEESKLHSTSSMDELAVVVRQTLGEDRFQQLLQDLNDIDLPFNNQLPSQAIAKRFLRFDLSLEDEVDAILQRIQDKDGQVNILDLVATLEGPHK